MDGGGSAVEEVIGGGVREKIVGLLCMFCGWGFVSWGLPGRWVQSGWVLCEGLAVWCCVYSLMGLWWWVLAGRWYWVRGDMGMCGCF